MVEQLRHAHFLRPVVLWLLVPIALGCISWLVQIGRRSPWAPFVHPTLLAHLEHQGSKKRAFGPEMLALILGALATLCAAGPTYRAQADSDDPAQSPLIVVFELSESMSKTDVSPSRAERARLELLDLLRARPSSPTALVVVAGTAHVAMPFTDDVAALLPYVEALSPDIMPSSGQNFTAAAQLVEHLIEASALHPAVLLVSDGMPAPGADAFRQLAQKRKLGLTALSLGQDDAERDVLSRLVQVDVELSFTSRDVKRLLAAIANARAGQVEAKDARYWQDEAPTWAWLIALGVAAWFRPGFLLPGQRRGTSKVVGIHRSSSATSRQLSTVALVLVLTGCSPTLESIWLTPDQQGQLSFDRGDYEKAARRFVDPRRKGLAYYAAEKWDQAAASFLELQDAEGLFMLGNAYAEGGKLQSALHAYERALEKQPTFRAARRNADRIRNLLHSLQEDTDLESAKQTEGDHGDDATQVDPDALAPKNMPKAHSVDNSAGDAPALESTAWLKRLTTDPSEFLKRKLATQAARGEAP